jgi:murein DD-endopeptidase MepM/ murein hydrolase activator NlpD
MACLFLLLSLAACQPKATATPEPGTAVPYQTVTPNQTPTVIPALTEIFLPTSTTYTYTVLQGDTFISIAQKAGVTLQALQAANPKVSATALSVGTKLVIPTGAQVPGEPTPTAAPLPVLQAHCWPETTGGLWCFGLLKNTYAETLENISAQFALLDSGGGQIASQVVYGLLDLLPPGAAMPLAAHFIAPVQADATVRVQVLTAIRLLPGDARYLPVRLENTLVSLEAAGQTADLSGRVILTGTGTANTIWVLASAYDAAGNVVGVRRWQSASALTADAPVTFDFPVSSLGPGIARVEFLAEARP